LAITPASVRTWRQELIKAGVDASTVAKAYPLLRAVLNTATDDELIARNPCRIKGAGVEATPERPVITLAQVLALAAAMPPRYRVVVLVAVFASMRWGELMGLRHADLDLETASVNIERSAVEIGTRS
jgi:integrase